MKKFLSVLMSAIMVLSIVPMAGVGSFAVTSGDYEYSVLSDTDKTCEIIDYTGSASDLVIPSNINGYAVTGISYQAFQGCTSLRSVSIPEGVTRIDDYVFSGCTSLTSVSIPNSVNFIGFLIFNCCPSLVSINVGGNNSAYSSADGVLFDKNKTILMVYPQGNPRTSYTVPSSVTELWGFSFFECTSLTSITIPNSVKIIGSSAFWGCTSLKSASIPNGVTRIGTYTFYDCASLASVSIPDSVTFISESAFSNCKSLKSVIIPSSKIEGYAFGYNYDEYMNKKKVDGFTIYGYDGTDAQRYANENGFTFISLSGNSAMHRLYNRYSGEHFYTADVNERDWLASLGWTYEGLGWIAPKTSSTPVYRLYNAPVGEHHYTIDVNEKNYLVSLGWTSEGTGWYSDDAQGVPLYRQYNPNAFANNHNYTTDKAENDWLVGLGWRAEGIGWYGVA